MPPRLCVPQVGLMMVLTVLSAACAGPDAAAPTVTAPAVTDSVADGHFRATFGDRTIDVLAKDLCLFGHVSPVGRSVIVNWQEQAAEPLSFGLAISPPPGATGTQKIAGFSIAHGNTGDVWMAPENASLQITELRRIKGGITISGTFSDTFPAVINPGQPQNPPMAVKGAFRNMECMDPSEFLPETPENAVPNSPLRPEPAITMHGRDDGH